MQNLGVDARSELGNGCPPVVVHAAGLPGGVVEIAGSLSSQFLSGLLMAAPYATGPIRLVVHGELVSKPYVRMTCQIMAAFGVAVECREFSEFLILAPTCYRPCARLSIEPDATAASYFLAAAAITGGRITVEGLTADSLQGDVAFVDCLAAMGCRVEKRPGGITVDGSPGLHGIEADMNAVSDTAQTLAAVALFAKGPTTIRGVAHIRHKETDRIGALACELRKFGAEVEELPDGLRIVPGLLRGAEIDTYDDHRMAMSLALVGLRVPGVVIRDPDCTRKTYPEFFQDLERLGKRT
jgi:3-phosphoshikimate 1-carboxyvinyltransferase